MSELSLDDIQKILQADKQRAASRPSGGRTKKDPTEPREYSTWWKLQQTHDSCDNEDCSDPRDGGGFNGTAMVTVVKDKKMCRYCFLAGWLSDAGNP